MINKDKSIINLIERLKLIINFSLVQIVDYWEADLCAIGLKKDDKLIYISTYSYDVNNMKYDYDLEIINKEREDNINVIKEVRSVSENKLVKDIKSFLEI
jgi:hypothetical protein